MSDGIWCCTVGGRGAEGSSARAEGKSINIKGWAEGPGRRGRSEGTERKGRVDSCRNPPASCGAGEGNILVHEDEQRDGAQTLP